MSAFLQKKFVKACKCSANKDSIFEYTYNESFGNSNKSEPVDILILLEHKELSSKLTSFLNLCATYFKKYTYEVIPSLGCTPAGFSSSDTVNTYLQCKENHIKAVIDKYKPKVIITTGRALYTITEGKDLQPEMFFVPVNDSLTSYQVDDTYIWSSEFNCKVFPIPALYQWIHESIKDVYEYKFVIAQFNRAISSLKERKPRKEILHFEEVVDTTSFLKELITKSGIEAIAIDTETSGFNYFEDKLFTIQFSYDGVTGYYLEFEKIDKQLLIELFERKDIKFVFQNSQFDLKFLKSNGVYNARCDFENMLASHLLNENSKNDLKSNTWLYTTHGGYQNSLKQYMKVNKVHDFTSLPKQLLLEYACYDAIVTYQLYKYFKNRLDLEDTDLKDNYYNYIIPAIEMIVDVEMTGVQIDMVYLEEYVESLRKKALAIEKELYELAGKQFNIKSGVQLSEVLRAMPNFKVLKDEHGKELLTKNGSLILDKDTVDRYAAESDLPFMTKISEYNHITKEISQFGYTLEQSQSMNKRALFETKDGDIEENAKGFLASMHKGRLYGGYKLHGTETGRMSGGGGLNSSINWQNMPATKEFRKIFLPTKGYIYGRSDYDAMEVCIASQIAGSGVLESLILDKKDMHCYTAVSLMKMFNIDTTYEEVFAKTKIDGQEDKLFLKWRKDSKGVNFSALYGSTKYGMASSFNVSVEDGEKFLNAFYDAYPEVKIYMDEYRALAKKNGYVKTLLGRKKRLPQLTYIGQDSWKNKSSFSLSNLLNSAINAPVQGTSGQTTLISMVNTHKEFKQKNMKSRIIINVHDEIVFELWIPELQEAEQIIKKWMEYKYYENQKECKVPLSAGLETGEIWKVAHSTSYWNTHQEEWNQCLKNIEDRNTNNSVERDEKFFK